MYVGQDAETKRKLLTKKVNAHQSLRLIGAKQIKNSYRISTLLIYMNSIGAYCIRAYIFFYKTFI